MGLINKEELKRFFKNEKMRMNEKFPASIESEIEKMLLESVKRAKNNQRTTVFGHDI